ncbi:WAT1-related protein [Dioscorea alata]|uniref:WAT1-related protein n=1 Tax=Dioscorea alata TaxID=55571 RepID=A0ACB7TZB8_DIOAL|nr:WAT1-related protein [Dioscorea alata]
MLPLALWFERNMRPKMTKGIFLKIFLLALLSVLDQIFYYLGAKYTSANFVASFNLVPVLTFIINILLRKEKIKVKNARSWLKIIGVLVITGGSLVMILYKGKMLGSSGMRPSTNIERHQLFGTFMLLLSCLCGASFSTLQDHVLKSYSTELSLSTFICLFSVIISGVTTSVVKPNPSAWKMGWNLRLVSIVYSGVICSGIAYYLQGVVIKKKGAVFSSAFSPLRMLIVDVLDPTVLAEGITLERIIGAVIMIIGLFLLLWGKMIDEKSKLEREEGIIDLPITVPMRTSTVNPM